MQPELQMIISVLTAGKPEEANETQLQRKLDMTPSEFRHRYHSFAELMRACADYCAVLLRTELDLVWRLPENAVQKLYYSLVVLQRPENQKRRRYFDLLEGQYPLLAAEIKPELVTDVRKHFQRVIIKGKQEDYVLPQIEAPATADRLWYLNSVALQNSLRAAPGYYWLEEVVHVLWPIVLPLFTITGRTAMDVSLATYPQAFNKYSR